MGDECNRARPCAGVHDTRVDGLEGIVYGNGSFVAAGGYASNLPRGVAVQSGGSPQVCLEAGGFGPASGFIRWFRREDRADWSACW
jgi:hypothetical protein